MSRSKLIELSYYDPKAEVRLSAYADTLVIDENAGKNTLCAIRFGGYPEMVNAMAAAICGGATIEAAGREDKLLLCCIPKGYVKQLAHDGVYATATLMATDDSQQAMSQDTDEPPEDPARQPRNCYIFCPAGDHDRLFEELDRKTAVPLIPDFRDYVLDTLIAEKSLRKLTVYSLKANMDAWVLSLLPDDRNVIGVLEDGLKKGQIQIPGAAPGAPDGFEDVHSVTSYLNTFGVTVADRIREQFEPLFDPATEPLSPEVLAINSYVRQKAGYALYDAQLAVAEAVKRKLRRDKVALIRAECGSGKTKIGSAAIGALYGLSASKPARRKTFNIVLCPSHMTRKWVREIGETLPDTYGFIVKKPSDIDRLYAVYRDGDKSVFAVMNKEKARDGAMRYPAVLWNRRRGAFLCPDCMEAIQMDISLDGTKYTENADPFFFLTEQQRNHKCPACGAVLWAPVNPGRNMAWTKISGFGWVYKPLASRYLDRAKNERVLEQLKEICERPNDRFPVKGAQRFYPLSTYAALHPSEPCVQTAGKIPEADIVFLDEIFKANDGILNSLLAALNERKYTNEGRTYPIPVISFFTASNEIPNFSDPQEKSLEALYDRLQIKAVTADIEDRAKRLELLRKKQTGACGRINATFTLEELEAMQKEVSALEIPDSINELADDILCELRRGGITVSDRKYLNYSSLAQAKAWLEGHDRVQAQDMYGTRRTRAWTTSTRPAPPRCKRINNY